MSEERLGEKPEEVTPEPGTGTEEVPEPTEVPEPAEKPEEEEPKGPVPYIRFEQANRDKNEAEERANSYRTMAQDATEALHQANEDRERAGRPALEPAERPLFAEEIPEEEMSPRVRQIFERQHGAIQELGARMDAQTQQFEQVGRDVYHESYEGALARVAPKIGLPVDTIRDKVLQVASDYGIPPRELEKAAQMAYGNLDAIKARYAPKTAAHREAGTPGGKPAFKRISEAEYLALKPAEQEAYDKASFDYATSQARQP